MKKSVRKIRGCAWNINGWKWDINRRKPKRNKIRSEIERYDIVTLTETHMNKEEIEEFEKTIGKDYNCYHSINTSKKNRAGVTIMIKNNIFEDRQIKKVEIDPRGGRWIIITVAYEDGEDRNFCAFYAPNKASERIKWLQAWSKKTKQLTGRVVMNGDFNFVMDTDLDKIGGRKNS